MFGQGVVTGPFGGAKPPSSLVFGNHPAAAAVVVAELAPSAEPMDGDEGELSEEPQQLQQVSAKPAAASTPLFGSAPGPFSGSSSTGQSFAGFGSGMFGAKFGAGGGSAVFGASIAPAIASGLFGKPATTSGTPLSFGGTSKGAPVFGSSALNAAAAPFSFGASSAPVFGSVVNAPAPTTPAPVAEVPLVVEAAAPVIVSIPQTVTSTTPVSI
jgi:hypothetical protein